MRSIDAIRRTPHSVPPDSTLAAVAALMEEAAIGAVAVVDEGAMVGIVTDRDLVCRGLARRAPEDARIDSVMSTPVITIGADADVRDALALFRENAVRRLPIVDGDAFVGMLSVDDLLINIAADLSDLSRPVAAEVLFGHHDPSVPSTTT